MASTERIESLISKEALAQFAQLAEITDANVLGFEKLVIKAVELNKQLGGAKTFKEIAAGMKEMGESEKQLTKQAEDLAKANARLQKLYDEQAKKLEELSQKAKKAGEGLSGVGDSFAEFGPKLDSSNSSFKGAIANLVSLNEQLKKNKQSQKDLQSEKKLLEGQDQELDAVKNGLSAIAERERKLISEEKLLKSAITDTNKEIRQRINLDKSAVGTRNNIDQQIRALKEERDLKVNINTDEGMARLAEINAEIDNLNKILEQTADSLSQRKINIGNYQGSAKIIVDALEKARVKTEQLTNTLGNTHPAAQAARREFEALQRITEKPQFLKVAAKYGDSKAETAAFTRELYHLENQGLGNTEVAEKLKERIAQLTDEMQDTRSEIKALSSDTRTFDLLASSVSFLTSTFQAAAGAALGLGASEENINEATKNLVAIENVANGIRGISNELTTKGTAANKVYSFAQLQVKTAMDATASSATRLRAALFTVGIGALIVGVGLLVANFGKLKDVLSRTGEQQKAVNEINKKAIEGYAQEKVRVELLVAEVDKETTTKKRKKEIIKELNAISPTYFGHIKTENDLQTKLNESVEKYVKAITIKAKTQAAEGLLVEKEQKIIARQVQLATELEDVKQKNFGNEQKRQDFVRKFQQYIESGSDKELQALEKNATPIRKIIAGLQSDLEKLGGDPITGIDVTNNDSKNLLEQQKIRLGIISDANQRIAANEEKSEEERIAALQKSTMAQINIVKLGKRQQLLDTSLSAADIETIEANTAAEVLKLEKDGLDKVKNLRKEYYDRLRQAQLTIQVTQLEGQAKVLDAIVADEKKGYGERLDAAYEAYTKRRAIVIAEHDEEVKNKTLTKEEVKALEKKYASDINQLTADYLATQLDLIKDNQEQHTETIEKEQQKRKDIISKEGSLGIVALNAALRDGNVTLSQYATQRSRIESEQRIKTLKEEQAKQTGLVVMSKEGTAERAAAEAALADITLKISDEVTNKQIENQKKVSDALKQLSSEGFELFSTIVLAQYERQKQAIDGQIDALERQKQKDIEVANQTITNEQEKAAAIATIEARANAQKEQLEIRKKRIEYERARTERAITIARIIADTAAAVVAALGSKPYSPANIALAAVTGAIGAAQIAKVAATPLPQFEHGTMDAPGGPSLVGEKRPELIVTPEGKMIPTPGVPTVMNVPKHSIVFPDLRAIMEGGLAVNKFGQLVEQKAAGDSRVAQKIDKLTAVIRNKPVVNLSADQGGLAAMWQWGANTMNYVEDQTKF